jgi:hypothetical protein
MHELSIAIALLELAVRELPPGAALKGARVSAGPLRAIEPDAMRFAWEAVLADAGLRDVTVNLERWEDADLVHAAEAVYAAELPVDPSPDARVARLVEATEGLARVRADGRPEWRRVAREVAGHARILDVLGDLNALPLERHQATGFADLLRALDASE